MHNCPLFTIHCLNLTLKKKEKERRQKPTGKDRKERGWDAEEEMALLTQCKKND